MQHLKGPNFANYFMAHGTNHARTVAGNLPGAALNFTGALFCHFSPNARVFSLLPLEQPSPLFHSADDYERSLA